MGTKVEGKIYVPGYFGMADSSVNSYGNVLPYYEENKPSGQFRDMLTIISVNGSVHYDKEMLKRTMLVHEATFRKQVYELHRLYKIQKDLMAPSVRKEFNDYPRYADMLQSWSDASQTPPGDDKGVWQTGTPISGHLKQSSMDFMNESSSQYSVNVASLRHNNVGSRKKMLDLELPADVYADDDDDLEILDKKPLKSLPGTNGSVHGRNVRLNLGNSEGSSHVEKSWITGIEPQHNSAVHILYKPAEESSIMKRTDFLGVGISTSQNHHHVSQGANLNLLVLQGNLRETCVGKVSGSSFFGANEEISPNNSFRQNKDGPNASMAWSKYKTSGTNSSTFNHSILALPGFNDALDSPWQSNNTKYLAKSDGIVETSIAKHALPHGISMGSIPHTPYHPSLKFHEEMPYRKHPPCHDDRNDFDLNDAPADTTAAWEQGSENSVVDTSWLRKKPVNLMKSQVSSSYANCQSQILLSSTYSERTPTTTLGFPISAAAEKDSQCSHTLHSGTNIAPMIEREVDMEMQPQNREADTNIRNLIDLNEALPIIDEPDEDVCESEGDIAPQEPDDPSRDSLAITASENLVAMSNDVIQPGSAQLDTLHRFAELATSKDNTVFNNDSDDDFEALTLKLQETKSYEYHSTPRTQEDNSNDGHCSAASLLVTRPRRGKARGRPRKKDFQKDILPVLASLLKHEVSEDLCALGWSKPVTPTKRGGRNGQQPRGRRRVKSVYVTVEEAEVSLPPVAPPLVAADLYADVLGITRWGRTRRCRRPRCLPANNASLRVAGEKFFGVLADENRSETVPFGDRVGEKLRN